MYSFVTLQQFHEMANLPMNVAVENKFLALRARNITNIEREDYAGFRDHLIMKLLCRSGQRPGALANLTVEEFNNGQWDQESDPPPLCDADAAPQDIFHGGGGHSLLE